MSDNQAILILKFLQQFTLNKNHSDSNSLLHIPRAQSEFKNLVSDDSDHTE